MNLHRGNPFMERYVARLYVEVFKFLICIMEKWQKSSFGRMTKSFDKNFLKIDLGLTRERIRDLSRKLESEGNMAAQMYMQKLATNESVSEQLAMLANVLVARLVPQVGQQTRQLLMEDFQAWNQSNMMQVSKVQSEASTLERPRSAIGSTNNPEASSGNLLEELGDYYDADSIAPLVERSHGLHINSEVLERIHLWFKEPLSKVLWLRGPFQVSMPSKNTLISAYIVDTARQAGIATIAHFFTQPDLDGVSDASGDCESPLVRAVYSLIFQMAEIIQRQGNANPMLLGTGGNQFDGTTSSLTDALTVFEDLLNIGPPLVFCVIDGSQFLPQKDCDGPHLRRLFSILRPSSGNRTSKITMKTLFTTDGFMDALAHLDIEETMDVALFARDSEAEFAPGHREIGLISL